jgi:ankyrin repeat protein
LITQQPEPAGGWKQIGNDAHGNSALHLAVGRGSYAFGVIATLCLFDAYIECVIPLMIMSLWLVFGICLVLFDMMRVGNEMMTALILNMGVVDVNEVDATGRTALHWAAALGSTYVVQMLCQSGAKCLVHDELGSTPLHYAVQVTTLLHTRNRVATRF